MADNRKKTAILVAGMHRSGTSALAQALGLAGCDLPRSLMSSCLRTGEHRIRGHSESWTISQLNAEILSSAKHQGYESINHAIDASVLTRQFNERAVTALRDEFADSHLFVLKDPRLCLLLKFWVNAVAEFGARPVVICPVRNPLEVAYSLKLRSATDHRTLNNLTFLWLRYVLDAEAYSRFVPRTFTRYSDLLEDPLTLLDKAAVALDVSLPRVSVLEAQNDIRAALSSSYRHHSVTKETLRSDPRCSRSTRQVYEILDRWVDTEIHPADTAELNRVKAIVDDATSSLVNLIAREKENGRENIAKFRNSRSWRVTAPLRVVSRAWKTIISLRFIKFLTKV